MQSGVTGVRLSLVTARGCVSPRCGSDGGDTESNAGQCARQPRAESWLSRLAISRLLGSHRLLARSSLPWLGLAPSPAAERRWVRHRWRGSWSAWPAERTYPMLRKWFEVRFYPLIQGLVGELRTALEGVEPLS